MLKDFKNNKKAERKRKLFNLRVEYINMLEKMAGITDISRTKIIEYGIKKLYEEEFLKEINNKTSKYI
jgi:hypothetical protein